VITPPTPRPLPAEIREEASAEELGQVKHQIMIEDCYGYNIQARGRYYESPNLPSPRIHDGVPVTKPTALKEIDLHQVLPKATLPELNTPVGWSSDTRNLIWPPREELSPLLVSRITGTSPHRGGHSHCIKSAAEAAPRKSIVDPLTLDTSRQSTQVIALETPETSSTNGAMPSSNAPP